MVSLFWFSSSIFLSAFLLFFFHRDISVALGASFCFILGFPGLNIYKGEAPDQSHQDYFHFRMDPPIHEGCYLFFLKKNNILDGPLALEELYARGRS